MKLTLRPEWRLWPLSSFLGILDLKTGVTVALIFALLNKVAGVYGLIAVLTGAGGSFAQLSLYLYSVVALIALTWGLKAVKEEDPKHTLYFAHFFFADHIFSTSWTVFFAVVWWVYTPHDGRRQANSAAQKEMMENAQTHTLTPEEREAAAMAIWNHEKGTAAAVIVIAWFFKIYLSLLLYSYATHLRKGSYRSLAYSRPAVATPSSSHHIYDTALGLPEDDEDVVDFYRVPLRSNHKPNNSVSSFADFVSAPGRSRRLRGSSLNYPPKANVIPEDEVHFDEDESTYAGSSRGHSKMSTDDSATNVDTDEELGKVHSDGIRTPGKLRE
ncbi:hypothetical protein AX16_001471 [Volvariella volvacea WC 439]|nr:hypothetical protein AX16_001471 [Volvariella volvacea WC 439]